MKKLTFLLIMIAFFGLNEAIGQWAASGSDIYNTNTGNVGIGNSSPSTLLYVGKNMTEPTITVRNLGGAGGASFRMWDNASGADWKFKATMNGGFKIRDNANSLDVFTIEANSEANVLYINASGNLGIGTATPAYRLDVPGGDANINGVRIGRGAGDINTNTVTGYNALFSNVSGDYNTANGYQALIYNNDGDFNTAIGYKSMNLRTTGTRNVALGASALYGNTTGNHNVAIGERALFGNSEGSSNVALGYCAGYFETESNRLYISNYLYPSQEAARAHSLIYGVFASNVNDQRLNIHGQVAIGATDSEVALRVASDFQFDPGDFGDNRKGSILLSSSGGTQGWGAYGPAIAFSGIDGGRRRAAIAAKQTSDDSDQIGLAFFIHPGTATANDIVYQAMVIEHNGYVGIGTPIPSSGLHVKGSQFPGSFLFLESDEDEDAGIRFYEGDTAQWHIFNNSALDGLHIYSSYGKTVFFADKTTGNTGIGVTGSDVALKVANYFQFDPGDVDDNRKGNILLSSVGGNQGLNAYGPALAFSGIDSGRRRAAIASIQTSGDADQMGLAFFTHPGTTTANDLIYQAMVIKHDGNVGIGRTNPTTKLDVGGVVTIRDESTGNIAVELGTGLDYAEGFNVSDLSNIEPGTVMCIDPENPGKLKVSNIKYDRKVAGIVAGANNLGSGISLGTGTHDVRVALAGRVYCNVDASDDPLEVGDLLTTSSLPGYAMKVNDRIESQGAILGKAMESLPKGHKGQILVLVTLQ